MRIRTYRHYGIYRAWRGHDITTRRADERVAVPFAAGKGVLQGPLLRARYAVLQTAVNIVYWLPPPISQTLVTRPCPSPTANKPRAVIWRRCLPFLVPRYIPRFDELSIFRPFDNSTSTSAKQKKISLIRVIVS